PANEIPSGDEDTLEEVDSAEGAAIQEEDPQEAAPLDGEISTEAGNASTEADSNDSARAADEPMEAESASAEESTATETDIPSEEASPPNTEVPLEPEDSTETSDAIDAEVEVAAPDDAEAEATAIDDAEAEDEAVDDDSVTAQSVPEDETQPDAESEDTVEPRLAAAAESESPRIDFEAIAEHSVDRLVSGLEALAEPARRIANEGQAVVERLGSIEGNGQRTHEAVVELGRQVGRIADREEQQSEAAQDDSQSPAAPLLYSIGLFLLALSWSMALLFRGRTTPTILALLVASNVFACLALWFGWRSGRKLVEVPAKGSAKTKAKKKAKAGKKQAEDATDDEPTTDSDSKDGAKTDVSADAPNPAA
ncbi:MAG: hypothetical protein KDC95_20925, partial [Planctomycetes bacterium]|nr:hypothetical protein [Planctomycetota bacterium]